jgi:hypothetical protein
MFIDDRRGEEPTMFSEYVVRAIAEDHIERLRREAVADRLARVAVRTMAESRPQRTAAGRVLRSFNRTGARHAVALSSRQPQPCGC